MRRKRYDFGSDTQYEWYGSTLNEHDMVILPMISRIFSAAIPHNTYDLALSSLKQELLAEVSSKGRAYVIQVLATLAKVSKWYLSDLNLLCETFRQHDFISLVPAGPISPDNYVLFDEQDAHNFKALVDQLYLDLSDFYRQEA